jgi:hypothetical protein
MGGTASLLFAFGASASAAPTAGGTEGGTATAGRTPAAAQAADDFAGYYVTPSHAFASASATFVVPKVTCTFSGTSEQDFGLADQAPNGESRNATAAVAAICDSGVVTYYFDANIGSEGTPETGIKAGDTVEVSMYQTGSIEEPKVFDLTTGKYWDAYTSPTPDSSVGLGMYSLAPTEKFATVSFTQVQVNGQYLSFEPNVAYNLLEGAKTLAKTSAVPAEGESFSVKFKANG